MRKMILFFMLALLVLFACEGKDINAPIPPSDQVSSIEVYEWDGEDLLTKVEEQAFIDELVEALQEASVHSTADMDYPLPDYLLVFKNEVDEELYDIGYYKEEMHLGVKGHYIHVEEDVMYQVDLILPFY